VATLFVLVIVSVSASYNAVTILPQAPAFESFERCEQIRKAWEEIAPRPGQTMRCVEVRSFRDGPSTGDRRAP